MTDTDTHPLHYPYPKRSDGHPHFTALMQDLYEQPVTAEGPPTVYLWDTDHRSPLIREAINHDVITLLSDHNGVFINEGDRNRQQQFDNYVSNPDITFPINYSYFEGLDGLRERLDESNIALWRSARTLDMPMYFPETPSDLRLARPLVNRIQNELFLSGGMFCSDVLHNVIHRSKTEEQKAESEVFNDKFFEWRTGRDLNKQIAEFTEDNIPAQPRLVLYGAAHGRIADYLPGNNTHILMLTSSSTRYKHKDNGDFRDDYDYVYFAAEDTVVKVPENPLLRALFMESLNQPLEEKLKTGLYFKDEPVCIAAISENPSFTENLGAAFITPFTGNGHGSAVAGVNMQVGRELVDALAKDAGKRQTPNVTAFIAGANDLIARLERGEEIPVAAASPGPATSETITAPAVISIAAPSTTPTSASPSR